MLFLESGKYIKMYQQYSIWLISLNTVDSLARTVVRTLLSNIRLLFRREARSILSFFIENRKLFEEMIEDKSMPKLQMDDLKDKAITI